LAPSTYSFLPNLVGSAAVFLQIVFADSFQSDAVISCPRGRMSDATAGATRAGEHDLFRSRLDQIVDLTQRW